jgi:hypothetical protein
MDPSPSADVVDSSMLPNISALSVIDNDVSVAAVTPNISVLAHL